MPLNENSTEQNGLETVVCAYCHTGNEAQCAALINGRTDVRALVPMRIRRDKEKTGWVDKSVKLFPSYLFLYATGEDALQKIQAAVRDRHMAIVTYGDGTRTLRGEDLAFARWIRQHGGVIGISSAVREGESIRIVEGALAQMRGTVRKVDRRHKLVQIELEINGFTTWLSYDWVDRMEEEKA